ncbi:hypothetical protein HPULCUR_011129 [Helicostylum pulchrum]|uniref:RING-type E3 ubiquitin transferase n=1 Tax=Helicostylum pulchrum TaxID=562976 RepID=A0ABP9YF91_9FUNG
MGQRQSSQQPQAPQTTASATESSLEQEAAVSTSTQTNTPRTGSIRPASRNQAQLNASRSQVIPTDQNQRRDERRLRRERHREQQEENEESNADSTNTNISPFSRMIASVISEAVLTSFRNGQMASLASPNITSTDTATTIAEATSTAPTTTPTPTATTTTPQTNVRQQLTMHLSPELFQQMEPGSTEDSFMRFMRLPVIVTSVSTRAEDDDETTTTTTTTTPTPTPAPSSSAVNADGEGPTLTNEESEVTRIIMLPVFLYGVRSFNNNSSQDEATPTRRRSERIRRATAAALAASAREEGEGTDSGTGTATTANERIGNGQWTVYIISGNSVEGIMNDSPSYEELLDLAALIGPARLPTVSQEAIDNHVPIVKYTQQVKQTIIGNSDGCQVCLNSYQSQDDVRVLACHHGFHQECIDTWLTIGKNQCPLCRGVPIPSSSSSSSY